MVLYRISYNLFLKHMTHLDNIIRDDHLKYSYIKSDIVILKMVRYSWKEEVSLGKVDSRSLSRFDLQICLYCNVLQYIGEMQNILKVQYSTHYNAVQYSLIQHSTIQYSIIQCSIVQHSIIEYSTVYHSISQHRMTKYHSIEWQNITA